jgi:hypothetical protein
VTWTTPRTWVAAEKPSAATLNTHIRDNFDALTNLEGFTPTWTGTGSNPAIGNGAISGGYINAGDLTWFYVSITMGSTTTYGTGSWGLSLPVAPFSTFRWGFEGTARDSSASQTWRITGEVASGAIALRCDATTAGNQLRDITPTVPFTWATNDTFLVTGKYRTA